MSIDTDTDNFIRNDTDTETNKLPAISAGINRSESHRLNGHVREKGNNMAESIFTRIGKARASGSGSFLRAGRYLLEISKVQHRQGFKGESYIVEAIVREAVAIEENVLPNAVGSQCSVVWTLKDDKPGKLDLTLGHIKSFVMALFNVTEATATPDDIDSAAEEICNNDPNTMTVGEDGQQVPVGVQPARGRLIKGVTNKITTLAKQDINVVNWSPVVQTPEEIQARRDVQDGKTPGTIAAPAAAKAA